MIRLYENFRAVFYAPFYLAHTLGAYESEGVEVLMATSPEPAESAKGVLQGRVEAAWGGPMRVMYHHAMDPDCELVCFCEVVPRDPFSLIGRNANPKFDLTQLGKFRSAVVNEVPTPWVTLLNDVREAGTDPEELAPETTRSMEDNVQALRKGDADVVQLFEPYVESLVGEGKGHIWYSAATRGLTSYTTLLTTRLILRTREDELLRMTRAMHRTLGWLHKSDDKDVADALAEFFPEFDVELLRGAVTRYKESDVWGKDTVLRQEGFERLKQALLAAGFIWKDVPYEQCVVTRLSETVLEENPPPL